jgi:hypothetical protein
MSADVVKIKSRDTVSDLKKLLQEVNKKREEDLDIHQADQLLNFKTMCGISDDLVDAKSRNSKLWTLLILSSTLNVLAGAFIMMNYLGVFQVGN